MSRAALRTVALGWVGGFVDAIGFLALFSMFTAHMSGNSVWFGAAIGAGNWRVGLHHLFPIPLFATGLAAGAVTVELARRRRLRAPFAPALVIEMALLALFMLAGAPHMGDGSLRAAPGAFYGLAALPALAMGLQNATLSRVAGQTLHTTYITGVLQTLAESAVRYGFWLIREVRGHGWRPALRGSPGEPALRAAGAAALTWLAYAAGALGGGLATQYWELHALALPIALLMVIAGVDLAWPDATA